MKKSGIRNSKEERQKYPPFFRKADGILIAVLAAAAVCLLTAFTFSGKAGLHTPQLEVLIGNRTAGVYDLREDRTIQIGETNVCEIRDGEVRMTEADCPDQICVHTKAITEKGGSIVCLPNHIVLRITDADPEGQEVDSIAE